MATEIEIVESVESNLSILEAMSTLSPEEEFTQPGQKLLYPRAATIVAAGAAILFVVLGVVGNLITILALWRSRKLRIHATTWFVLSLCFSDFLFCTINLPLTASRYIHEAWVFNETLCKIFPFFFYANFGASLLNIKLIAINRYVLISHYSMYDKIYKCRNIIAMIIFVWTFSFSLMIPPMLEVWGRFGLDEESFSCTIMKKNGKSPKKFLFVFGILIPCLTIVYCYTCIFFKVRKSRRNLNSHGLSVPDIGLDKQLKQATVSMTTPAQRRDDMRLTKMMVLIFLCFLTCFLPLMIFNVVDDDVDVPVLHVMASILAWASAVINPFIYAMTNRQYRQAYWDLLSCRDKSERHSRSQNHTTSRSGSGKTFLTTEMVQVNAGGDIMSCSLTN